MRVYDRIRNSFPKRKTLSRIIIKSFERALTSFTICDAQAYYYIVGQTVCDVTK